MSLLTLSLLAQLAAARPVQPVLAFPEPGLDDTAAYQGYTTRFFRDAAGNTVQIYLDRRQARVVHLWANAENESIGFTARAGGGGPAPLRWADGQATPSRSGRSRSLEYRLVSDSPELHLGWFLLGSMRVERDFQYWRRHAAPFDSAAFVLDETARLLDALDRLPAAVRTRHLASLGAPTTAAVRARLKPSITTRTAGGQWVARVAQPALDARDTLFLEVRADPARVAGTRAGDSVSLRARSGSEVPFTIRITTSGRALTPLARREIFTEDFLAFLDSAQTAARGAPAGDSATIRARWLERQVRGVELLSSREKLMAGLPTYATYFGRDMQVAALMMRTIWRPEMSEFVVGSVLRKLAPDGQVSHEEALGGQAVREASAEYASLVDAHLRAAEAGRRAEADSLLARAAAVLRDARRVRENYHMIDDELQLPILAGRWLADTAVPDARKRAFLLDSSDGSGTRLVRLLRELGLVARMTERYAADPSPANLVSFAPRDSGHWASTSWRDSRAGYADGRYAMDVNAIYAPHALESAGRILEQVRALGFSIDELARSVPALAPDATLGRWARDPSLLASAAERWRGAWRHFLVQLGPDEVRARVAARLAIMPEGERAHWTRVLSETGADRDSLTFLALALDGDARPIGVANSDPATRLFLGEREQGAPLDSAAMAGVLRDVRLFVRHYPVGLFVDGVGPVVANDAYATGAVWREFLRDHYHGPRVVWGREVNLFLLGVAGHARAAGEGTAFGRELRDAAGRVVAAVEASGFQSELWSYELRDGRIVPIRYGSGADIQLWSTTDLAVQYALARLGR